MNRRRYGRAWIITILLSNILSVAGVTASAGVTLSTSYTEALLLAERERAELFATNKLFDLRLKNTEDTIKSVLEQHEAIRALLTRATYVLIGNLITMVCGLSVYIIRTRQGRKS